MTAPFLQPVTRRSLAAGALLAGSRAAWAAGGPGVADRVGGGNLVANQAGARLQPMYDALRGVGARLGRMNSYEWRRPDGTPTPRTLDAAMGQAHANGITPILLLEHYGSYRDLTPPRPLLGYEAWCAAGRALAERFRPNGAWGRERNVRDWGVTTIAAMNEPDVEESIPHRDYREALAGLADGVHAVDPTLRVLPGGFATCNSHRDATLRGYGPAIADLLDGGRLDGIDLHTYYHARWFPIGEGATFSAQACFDAVKRAAGVTRDVGFYATEFNVADVGRDGSPLPDDELAGLFLTGLWDHLGVAGADGRTPISRLVFPWNLAETPGPGPEGGIYALATRRAPWAGDARARVLRMVVELTRGMALRSVDRIRGEVRLGDGRRTLLVWHNRTGWSDRAGDTYLLTLPAGATRVRTWTHRGPSGIANVSGKTDVTIGKLRRETTYMFLSQ